MPLFSSLTYAADSEIVLIHPALLLTLALMYDKDDAPVWTRAVREIAEMPPSAPSSGTSVAYAQQEQISMKVPPPAAYDTPVSNAQSVPYQSTAYQPTAYQPTTHTPTTMESAPQTAQAPGFNHVQV